MMLLFSSEESWFDTRLAVILFSTFAAVSYVVASVAAWKWWRQRVQQQEEEAARLEAREAQRSERRRHRHDSRRRRTRGLPVELVSRLPTANVQLAELDREDDEDPSCSICLCEYEEGEKVTWLPCSHSFHASCISSWLKNSLICPICKDNVKRSLLKTLSMYRELHRTGLPDIPESGSGRSGPPASTSSVPAAASGSVQLEMTPQRQTAMVPQRIQAQASVHFQLEQAESGDGRDPAPHSSIPVASSPLQPADSQGGQSGALPLYHSSALPLSPGGAGSPADAGSTGDQQV